MAGKVLSNRYIKSVPTIPVGADFDHHVSILVPLGEVTLDAIHLTIPPGHHGLTGIQFRYAEVPFIPWNDAGKYISGDGIDHTFLVDFDVSAPVEIVAWNIDLYPHDFHIMFQIHDIVASIRQSATIVPI